MADKKKESPIKDTNKNGVLDSAEIIAQLRAEEEQGSKRTPNEKVHGVLEEMGFREYAEKYFSLLLKNNGNGKVVDKIKQSGALDLEWGFNVAIKQNTPDFDRLVAKRREGIIASSASPEEKKLELADVDSYVDLVKTINQTFPKGVRIEPKDATEIIGHLAPPIVVPIPNQSQQQGMQGTKSSPAMDM